jgi:hypothetical protein
MSKIIMLWLLTLVAASSCGTLADAIAASMPLSDAQIRCDDWSAVVTLDGAVWLCWTQRSARASVTDTTEWSTSANLGLFCRLVAPNGRVVVPTTRVLRPTIQSGEEGGLACLPPDDYVPVPRPDGSLVILADRRTTYREREYPVAADVGKPGMTATLVDRQGKVSSVALPGRFEAGRWGQGNHLSASVWTWENSLGDLCVLASNRGCLWYDELGVKDGKLLMSAPSRFFVVTRGCRDSLYRLVPETYRPALLRLIPGEADNIGMTEVGPDTLLIAYQRGRRTKPTSWAGKVPGDTLVTYRVLTTDFSVVDSFRLPVAQVSGADFDEELRFPRAALVRTDSGYAFFIWRPSGAAMYRLDARGAPVIGTRIQSATSEPEDLKGADVQLVSIVNPTAQMPFSLQIEWFGFAPDGSVSHAYATRPVR